MRRILLYFTLLTYGFTGANGQSFEINPYGGNLKSYTSLVGGLVNISHGISTADKIVAIDITVNAAAPSANDFVPPNYTYHAGHEFNYHYDDGAISVRNMPDNSANILSRPVKTLVTYKE